MITNSYIFICVVVFIYINFISKEDHTTSIMKLGALYVPKVREGEWWRMITCHFIHENIMHLFMNMYCIYFLGNYFESMLGIYYIPLVIMGMLTSSLFTVLAPMYFPMLDNHMTIGASGVAFAYFGAMIGLALFSKDSYFMLILQGYLYIIIINLLFTFLMPGISKTGHIGGLIGGYLFTFILYLVGLLK